MQKKSLQLQPRILLNKYHRRPGQRVLFFRYCLNVGCLLLTSHLPSLQIKLNVFFFLLLLVLPPPFLSKMNRNNTKPKQESQFDFKPPPASQVRSSFQMCSICAACDCSSWTATCSPGGNVCNGGSAPSSSCLFEKWRSLSSL